MKKQIVRISIVQSSKMVVILCTLVGLVYGLLGATLILFGKGLLSSIGWAYVMMPLVMPAVGFVAFVILAAAYNLLVRWVGGFEFEVEAAEGDGADAADEVNS